MKTIGKSFIIIMIIIIVVSCKSTMKLIYGVKRPRAESSVLITSFLKEIGIHDTVVFVCKDSNSWISIIKEVKGFPEAEYFDCNGFIIPYRINPTDCNARAGDFIDILFSTKTFSVDQTNIQSRLIHIVDSKGLNPVKFENLPRTDYYIALYFTKWTGKKVNREHISEWKRKIDELNASSSFKATILLINLDTMDHWGTK